MQRLYARLLLITMPAFALALSLSLFTLPHQKKTRPNSRRRRVVPSLPPPSPDCFLGTITNPFNGLAVGVVCRDLFIAAVVSSPASLRPFVFVFCFVLFWVFILFCFISHSFAPRLSFTSPFYHLGPAISCDLLCALEAARFCSLPHTPHECRHTRRRTAKRGDTD